MKIILTVAVLIITVFIIPTPQVHPEEDDTVLYRQGMEQYEKKNYKSAYNLFHRSILKNPFNKEASVMYWKMKSDFKPGDLADDTEGQLKDTEKEPVPDSKEKKEAIEERPGKKEAAVVRPKKKEKPYRDALAERESASALRELRGKITELNERIDTREHEIALLEKQHKQNWETERDNSRKMFRISATILIVLLAVSTGMLIFAFITISRREKRQYGTLLTETTGAGYEMAIQEQTAGGRQVPYPYQGRQEAWQTAPGGPVARHNPRADIGRPMDETPAISTSEYFSKIEVTISGFVRLIEHRLNRDSNDFRVRKLCHDIGKKLGLTSVEIMELRIAALMKDIGFLLIPEALLLKAKALTKQEKEKVQKHVTHSLKIAQYSPQPPRILEAVEKHHERMDGSGYPYGIKGDSIPLFSRIIGICDTFIALTSDRPYRAALDNDTALSVMERESRLFDPDILVLLFELFGQEVVRSQKPGEYLLDKDLYPDETLGPRE